MLKNSDQNIEAEPTPQFLEPSNEVNEPQIDNTDSDNEDMRQELLFSSSI